MLQNLPCFVHFIIMLFSWRETVAILKSSHQDASFYRRGMSLSQNDMSEKFYCLRQVQLAGKLLQATHTQNRGKKT